MNWLISIIKTMMPLANAALRGIGGWVTGSSISLLQPIAFIFVSISSMLTVAG